jgi:hypothetical protein
VFITDLFYNHSIMHKGTTAVKALSGHSIIEDPFGRPGGRSSLTPKDLCIESHGRVVGMAEVERF